MTEEGRTSEGANRARKLFETHMPELVPVLDRLAGQLDRPEGETFLTLAALRPFFSGCTQIGGGGTLVRNYDFSPDECEGTIVSSQYATPPLPRAGCVPNWAGTGDRLPRRNGRVRVTAPEPGRHRP
ncbi:hypothetical protein [Streptomyces sp. NPDC002324]